ncbi:transcriptional regulator [Sphaerisporangium siamense]|uniref:Transcriptional regulator with XRE-family HTH domain n=1 Tax=Sphaerisporangium siamense TaxID=795645 RepID=A0A7W7G977_9ACTN|nr:helix-turn-helix domain-containing protein [Sphaerisporangium siamense]MBB4701002.1 transcriptional regulator with XRE-family HTH domain [Sphaerisporangium siamense]GII85853.1 transcriptional regulator [Sphaerisporangium siamense]
MGDEATIGARLRTLRRWRRMTLAQVAGQAGLSTGFLSMAERGLRTLDRRSHIAALAAALRVSEADLTGGAYLSADLVQAEPHITIPNLRAALLTNTLTAPAVADARPLTELVAEMARIDRSEHKFTDVGRMLPGLIDELHVHACAPVDEAAYRLALSTLIDAFQTATFVPKDLGYGDLASIAAMRASEVARTLGDPISLGKAASLRVHTLPTTSWQVKLRTAETAAEALQPQVADGLGIQVLGMLTLASALAATVAHNAGRADHWLAQADQLARRIPDTPGENWGAFSVSNVAVWRIALAVERGESGGTVLNLARHVDERRLAARSGRHSAFLADIGRALARERRTRGEAVQWLLRAERVAPHKIRNDVKVKETVAVMLEQGKGASLDRELRGMASRMGVAH